MKGEEMQSIMAEAKRNRFATIPKLSDEDVGYVWDTVSEFIGKTMGSQKGVVIPSLGVFTLSQRKLDVGNNKFILVQRPVFQVSEKFAMTHALQTTKYHTDGQIPVVSLNFAAISQETSMERDTVEGCVREMLQALSRSVQTKKNVEFIFPSIGKLSIKDSRVKMKFYKDFLQNIDGSGALVNAMRNRPETSDSVISRSMTPFGRPSTSASTIYLPRINPGDEIDETGNKDSSITGSNLKKRSLMPIINEETAGLGTDIDGLAVLEISPRIEKQKNDTDKQGEKEANNESPRVANNVAKVYGFCLLVCHLKTERCDFESSVNLASSGSIKQHFVAIAMASVAQANTFKNVFNLHDYDVGPSYLGNETFRGLRDLHGECLPLLNIYGPQSPMRLKTAPEKPMTSHGLVQPDSMLPRNEVTFDHSNLERIKLKTASKPSSRGLKSIPKTAFGDDDRNKDSDSFVPVKKTLRTKTIDKTGPVSRCSNCLHDAGQELCYLCYQRERRNVPIYLHEERRKKELEEDRLLQQYQHIKDYEAILKDQDAKAANRAEAQKVAAFNLGVSEAVKTKKAERPTDFHRSFVFYKRNVSPPFAFTQQNYHSDLADQVKQREHNLLKSRKEKDFMERLEQVQLAEDLAVQREQYLRNKRLQSEEYKKALDTQIYIKRCIERQFQVDTGRCRKGLTIPKANVIQPFQDTSSSEPVYRGIREPRGRNTMRFRPLPIAGAYPDAEMPYFGKNDMNHEKMIEKRARARKLFEDQLGAAAEKKRNAILNDLRTQKEESLMLTRAKTDLLDETINRNRERVKIRRDLEDTWLHAAKTKHVREADDRVRAQSPGCLLHEQCDKYRRCKECKRKMPNCGESNVWCESRYLSGSRIMV
eukprot:gene17226-8778_t